jgi:FkbM family methyltransferase
MTTPSDPATPTPEPTGGAVPAHDAVPAYDEVIVSRDIRVPFVPGRVPPPIERPLRSGRYGKAERQALSRVLVPEDRVLVLGAGLGVLSTAAALVTGSERVVAVEANPVLVPMARETHRLNGVAGVRVEHAMVGPGPAEGGDAPFHLRADPFASSSDPTRPHLDTLRVPVRSLAALVAEHAPTVILCDLDGAEDGLFAAADLSGVRALIVVLHPRLYGEAGAGRVAAALAARGLAPLPGDADSPVRAFLRTAAAAAAEARDQGPWPPADPRVLIATCMKDEGPFVLEWIAWHRAIGVTDFVVYTNHCSDGTDRILDRLAEMGLVTHLENPAVAEGSTFYQPAALGHVQTLPVFAACDFFISMDVDEFINIRTGSGRLADLFAAAGRFDVLSLFELNHGSNRREHYERGWVRDLFPLHQAERPGPHRATRGVKSIVRRGPAIAQMRNHRPDIALPPDRVVWLDSSGRPLPALAEDRSLNGGDCRGAYGLAVLDHYPLRSLASYLVKMFRGDVVIDGKRVGQRYWRTRNGNEEATSGPGLAAPAARAEYARLIADPALARLHEAACAAHEARIASLMDLPEYRERRDWVLTQAW